ncbi:hypothetical protein [Methylorubrum sp. SL192]|nr:hypothetical protein [Methylorubrum sp. SL192]MCY1640572.1 hypothetical protein [Methylorubrum sp. SL192]
MTGSEGACCGSIMDIRNLNAAGISESESEPKFDADPGSMFDAV